MSISRFNYLFQQFVNKTATPDESAEFLSMMKREDYNEELQVLLDEFWNDPSSITPLGQARAERIFNQIIASALANEPVKLHRTGKRLWLRAVAAVLILISISALIYKVESPDNRLATVVKNSKPVKPDKPGRRFINLPDGSSVILNENSRLEFGRFNANGKREVYLEGEAYFDIKRDASRPFIVYTGKLQTTVLGTAFNINSNSQNGTITVTVTRGKVKVGDKTHIFNVIDPDEQVVFDKRLSQHIKKSVKAETFIAWKNEDIYFDDVYIKDVANQLEERFNVSIIFSSEIIKNCRFSATFLKSQSLEQILNVIGEFNHIKYQYQDKSTVVLDGIGCN